jgi:hypothetical protein
VLTIQTEALRALLAGETEANEVRLAGDADLLDRFVAAFQLPQQASVSRTIPADAMPNYVPRGTLRRRDPAFGRTIGFAHIGGERGNTPRVLGVTESAESQALLMPEEGLEPPTRGL